MPAEDSYLLSECVRKFLDSLSDKNILVLDMGSGSGVQAETCAGAGVPRENILAVDIDKECVEHARNRGFSAVCSDLFSGVEGVFDLIIFNPPYLPEDEKEKGIDTSGGRKGYETALRFLRQAGNHLKKSGRIFILLSSLGGLEEARKKAEKIFDVRETGSCRIFFEELHVFEMRHKGL